MAVVVALARRVEAHPCRKADWARWPVVGLGWIVRGRDDRDLARLAFLEPFDVEALAPGEAERGRRRPPASWSGRMPIMSRFERWIRSKLSAITARTPSRFGPFAAQSRDDPDPYSLPARTISGTPSSW